MRRTRIVSTIGPSCDSPEVLESILRAGVDVCRLNYSHGEPAGKTAIYERIRQFEEVLGKPTCILADLPGPKLRLGEFPGVIVLVKGQSVDLHCGVAKMRNASAAKLPVEYAGLSSELNVNDPVLIADGLIRLIVKQTEAKSGGIVTCEVDDGGPVSARKGINVPGTMVDLPAIGPHDKLALEHALENGADYIAVSYVRTAEDLLPAREAIKKAGQHVPIIAKIEHPTALENLEEILDVADAVMVARGDLGVEIPLEQVPLAQQKIIDGALQRGMPVIVATQMLDSMILNSRPTRAEVSDISNAIRFGATAVMLSGETASGNYPLQSVETMAKIAIATEQGLESSGASPSGSVRYKATRAVAHAGVELAKISKAVRLVVATEHGNAPRLVAGHQPGIPITAVSDRIRAARRVQLLPGVDSIIIKEHQRGSETMEVAVSALLADGRLNLGDRVVAISGSPLAMRGVTSTIRMYRISKDGTILGAE